MELDSQVNQSMKYWADFEKQGTEYSLRGKNFTDIYAGLKIKCEETLTKMSTWEGMEGTVQSSIEVWKCLAEMFVLNVIIRENGATSWGVKEQYMQGKGIR